MKKILANFVTVVLTGTLCLGLAACGEGETNIETEIEELESAQVTAEQWDAAFEAINAEDAKYGLEYSCSFEYALKNDVPRTSWKMIQTATGRFIWSGENAKMTIEESTAKTESDPKIEVEDFSEEDIAKANFSNAEYFIAPGERYEQDLYEQNDEGKWVKHSLGNAGGDNGYRGLTVFLQYMVQYASSLEWLEDGPGLSYETYTFSEEQKGYYLELPADSESDLFYWNTTLKFNQAGKLAAILVDMSGKDWGGVVTYKINFLFKDSTEEITLPTVEE